MITLADLGSLHLECGDAWAAPVTPVVLAGPHGDVVVGDEFRKAEGFYGVLATLGGAHLLRIHEVPHLRVVLNALQALEVR